MPTTTTRIPDLSTLNRGIIAAGHGRTPVRHIRRAALLLYRYDHAFNSFRALAPTLRARPDLASARDAAQRGSDQQKLRVLREHMAAAMLGTFIVEPKAGRDAIANALLANIKAHNSRGGLDFLLLTVLSHLESSKSATLAEARAAWASTANSADNAEAAFDTSTGKVVALPHQAFDPKVGGKEFTASKSAFEQRIDAKNGTYVMEGNRQCELTVSTAGALIGTAAGLLATKGKPSGGVAGEAWGKDMGDLLGPSLCGMLYGSAPEIRDNGAGGAGGGGAAAGAEEELPEWQGPTMDEGGCFPEPDTSGPEGMGSTTGGSSTGSDEYGPGSSIMWGAPGTDSGGSSTGDSTGACTQQETNEHEQTTGNQAGSTDVDTHEGDGGGSDTSGGGGGNDWPNPEDYPAPDDGSGNPISFISVVGMPSASALKSMVATRNTLGDFSVTMIDARAASLENPAADTHLFGHDFSVMKHVSDAVGLQANVAKAMQHALGDLKSRQAGIGTIVAKTPRVDGALGAHR